jgi:TonB-dependent starch-binding outer membrane protein SusC
LRAVVGSDILNVTRMVFSNPTILPSLNVLSEVKDEIARGLNDSPKVNSYYLEDGSFVRMEHITLGYNLSPSGINWLQRVRLNITANNLFLLTRYTGLDPETNFDGLSFGLDQYNVYPKTRSFSFGITATF